MSSSFKSSVIQQPATMKVPPKESNTATAIAKPKTMTTSTISNSGTAIPKPALPPQQQQQPPQHSPQQPLQQPRQPQQDAAVYVRSLLDEMQHRFDTMSKQIIAKIDSVGSKVEALDAEIVELMHEAGVVNEGQQKSDMKQEAAGNEMETTLKNTPASNLGQEPTNE